METRIINGSLTEIYANGGGYLTEAYPTNFHTFVKRKVLTASEKAEDWKEVTEKEKTTLEASDAAWERPPQAFIDLWNNAARPYILMSGFVEYGKYNEETGFFELNGLTDITYEQALEIYNFSWLEPDKSEFIGQNARTNFLLWSYDNRYSTGGSATKNGARIYSSFGWVGLNIEVMRVSPDNQSLQFAISPGTSSMARLRKILGVLDISRITVVFSIGASKLEEVKITNAKCNLSFREANKLSFESIQYMVTKASNTTPITITVHPDLYAKLTDVENGEWFALNELAISKNITFAS